MSLPSIEQIINPSTGRFIRAGGPTHKKLLREQALDNSKNSTSQTPQNYQNYQNYQKSSPKKFGGNVYNLHKNKNKHEEKYSEEKYSEEKYPQLPSTTSSLQQEKYFKQQENNLPIQETNNFQDIADQKAEELLEKYQHRIEQAYNDPSIDFEKYIASLI